MASFRVRDGASLFWWCIGFFPPAGDFHHDIRVSDVCRVPKLHSSRVRRDAYRRAGRISVAPAQLQPVVSDAGTADLASRHPAAAGGSRPYQVVFLVECPACEKARCARCKPHGRPRLVPVTAPVIVDPAQRWQTRRCVPQTAAELAKERWKVYQATHRKTSPRRGKRRDGRGPIALVRKIRQRQLLLMGDALAATLRDEVIEAQLRDLDALEQAIARRSVRAGRKDASLAG